MRTDVSKNRMLILDSPRESGQMMSDDDATGNGSLYGLSKRVDVKLRSQESVVASEEEGIFMGAAFPPSYMYLTFCFR